MATLIEELGVKWNDFTDEQKAGLSEAIAGANQASVFQSLMSNLDIMKEVQNELNQGWHFGSALAENEQYVDSLSGKLNKLKETWVGIFNTLFDSNAAKGIIDVLIKISEAISKVVETLDDLGMLTPVLVGLGTVLAGKAFSGIGNIFSSGEKSAKGFMSVLPGLTNCFTSMNPPATKFGATLVGMGTKMAGAGTTISGFLGTASSFVPWAVAAGVAVAGVTKAVDYFTESLDEEEQRLNETVSSRKEEISTLNEQKSKLQEIQKEYDTLANKPNKTVQEVEKLKTLTQELAQIKPELVIGYDEGGNPILSMTGDVQDLIKEIDRAVEGKNKLLSTEKQESAKNSIKQLHGNDKSGTLYGNMFNSDATGEMDKLEKTTSKHINNMSKLEAKRDKILNKLYDASGKERQKLLKDLDKANYDIEKAQDEYVNKYQEQLNVIKEYSDKIGEGLFSGIESSTRFSSASEEIQKNFSSLKKHLDFSDIKTEDQLYAAEHALEKLLYAAKNGDVDLGKLKSSIEKANIEFAKTGDSEKYANTIENIIKTLKEIPGLEYIDFDVLKGMFEGMDTSVTKGKDALDEFLRAYNKTRSDIEKGDGFAKALAEQKRHIEEAFNNLEITGKTEVDYEVAWNLINDEDLPTQLREMVKTLINKGHDSTEVLKFAQQVLVDLSDGEIDIESLQDTLNKKFGENSFEITPEILLNENARIAGVETVVKQITERFGEIPPTVKTIIEAEGITAFNEAKKLTEIYLSIPKEVRTHMTNNGLESASDVLYIDNLLNNLPTSIVTNIVSNFPDVFKDAKSMEDVINNLPASVLLEIKSNYPEAVEKSKLLQDAIDKIPNTKESKISVTEEIKKDPMSLLDRLFGRNKSDMTATAVINSQVNGLDSLKDFDSIWSSITGKGNGASGAGSSSNKKRSVDAYDIATVEEMSNLARSGNNSVSGSGGSGFNATVNVTVNGIEDIRQLQEVMNNLVINDISATVTVNTSLAANNLSGLIVRINQVKASLGSLSSKNVAVNTAQSAKNLSGLITRVNQYKSAIDSALSKTVDIHTAQAAKNVSGLIRKIDEYNKVEPKTITFKTNADSMTSKVRALISAIKNVPNGKTIAYNIKTTKSVSKESGARSIDAPYSSQVQARTIEAQAQLRNASIGEPVAINNENTGTIASPMVRALSANNVISYLDSGVDAFKSLEDMLNRISNELDLLGKKAENAFGEEKISYLKRQVELLEEQQRIQQELSKDYAVQQNELKYYLSQKGFTFNSSGDVTNQAEKLFQMEKYVKQLEEKVNAQGSEKNEALSNQYESARNELEKTKKVLNEYISNNSNGVNGAISEWYELQQQINKTRMEIIQATIDAKNFKFEINAKKFEAELEQISDAIALIDKQLVYATGSQKDDLFKNKIELLRKQQQELHNLANQYRASASTIAEFLNSKGFIIETDGSIGNIEFLEVFKDTGIYEEINDQIEKYLELTQNKIPSLQTEWWEVKEAIDDTRISILEAKDELSDIVLDINVTKLENAISKIKNEIKKLEREIDKSFGSKKESLLNEKISQLQKEQGKLHDLANAYREQRQEIYDFINSKGFIIHPDGEIGNPEYILNFKDDPAMFQYLQGLIDKYNSLGSTIDGLGQDWWDLQDSIEDTQDQIEEARKELAKFIEEAKVDAIRDKFNDLANALDLIDKKLKHATGLTKLDLIEEKLNIIKEQQVEIQKQWDFFNSKKSSLQFELGNLGFTFDSDGNITNYVSQLESVANSASDFEEVKEKLEEYFEIQDNELPDLQNSWQDLENAYKDTLKEQLNTTKEIEDKLTDIYKKQIEDRIKAMEKETDAKLKSLKKQQDAYNKYREETDYKNEYEDKLSEINDIQKQLDIAMRDTSLSGQKKVKELQKLLADTQKELDKFTQNKIDNDINDMFDKESERIEEENKNAIEKLEDEWSDSKIAEMVAKALGSGVFTDIEGNVSNLEDALINFAEETGELFGVLGTVIKSELITNLEIAKATVSELSTIMKGLDLSQYMSAQNTRGISDITGAIATSSTYSNINNQVSITAPIINIEGNVDANVVNDLKDISNRIKEDVLNAIATSYR